MIPLSICPISTCFCGNYSQSRRQVITVSKQQANLPNGLCAVVSMGNCDHTPGGHLVLHELKHIMEFPPGYVILLPSASITHSNMRVSAS
ncbi:hypothetical protein EDB85DRAFT_1877742 [Lactarius pseudohatsudake]|nr:hypothetical protein EDB85DRAFT_1877742 [Lactarius pseudohatsudake]